MAERRKTATLSRGRNSWCMIFRHPVCTAANGREHLRIRRGLGTGKKREAEYMVSQLNALLADPSFWKISERERATHEFDPIVVSAFFDPLDPQIRDPWSDRERAIPLPGGKDSTDGYARVQLIGTTGAGKTTLLRQIIGTDPVKERFPSISAAKTTVCDIEIVMDTGPYRAVVSFIEKNLVRQYTMDCVCAAAMCVLENRSDSDIARRFLEHAEQRFRLGYLLGMPAPSASDTSLVDEDLDEDEDEDHDIFETGPDALTDTERKALQTTLGEYMDEVRGIGEMAREFRKLAAGTRKIDLTNATNSELNELLEEVECEICKHKTVSHLVDKIVDDIETRFESLATGTIEHGRDGWPITWSITSDRRQEFIRSVNRFSSNYAPSFGKLLTPLVEGIRVAGDFSPRWRTEQPKLVILDGQGLGHKADIDSSISTNITSRFQRVDAIVLVDNATQPMQIAPCSAINSIVASGHESKLIVAFTHFDEVSGDNLVGPQARKNHVLGSFDNAVNVIAKSNGSNTANGLRRTMDSRIIFLSKIQKTLGPGAKATRRELEALLDAIDQSIAPVEPTEFRPVYDVTNLVLAIQAATHEFHDRWRGILNMGSRSGVISEHWTRIKALARRLGYLHQVEYDSLRPVADLIRLIQSHLSQYLSTPIKWDPHNPPDADLAQTVVIDSIRQDIYSKLHELSRRRIKDEQFTGWQEAYDLSGSGSTFVRAREIVGLYETAAPIPNEMQGPDAKEFLLEIQELVAESIRNNNGILKGWTSDSPGESLKVELPPKSLKQRSHSERH